MGSLYDGWFWVVLCKQSGAESKHSGLHIHPSFKANEWNIPHNFRIIGEALVQMQPNQVVTNCVVIGAGLREHMWFKSKSRSPCIRGHHMKKNVAPLAPPKTFWLWARDTHHVMSYVQLTTNLPKSWHLTRVWLLDSTYNKVIVLSCLRCR